MLKPKVFLYLLIFLATVILSGCDIFNIGSAGEQIGQGIEGAGREIGEGIEQGASGLQPLKEIDPEIISAAGQFSDRLRDFNQRAIELTRIIGGNGIRAQAQVSADVGKNLNERIQEFNQIIEGINNITFGIDENTLIRLDGLMMIIERGIKVGLDTETLKVLDGFRVEMANQPERWQDVLLKTITQLESSSSNVAQDVAGQLTLVSEQASNDVIRVIDEVKIDVKEVIASTGVEGRCNADFLEKKLENKVRAFIGKGMLYRVRASLLGEVSPSQYLPVSGVCHFVPSKLALVMNSDMLLAEKPTIDVFGYGFTQDNRPEVKLVNPLGEVIDGVSLISVLVTTQYQLTINLQGTNFTQLGYQDKLILSWPNLLEPNELAFIFPSTPTPTPLAATSTPTPTTIPEPIVIISNSDGTGANIRSGPGINYSILYGATNGEEFSVTGKSEDGAWWRIDYNQQVGYIFGQLAVAKHIDSIAMVRDPSFTPTPLPPPTPTNVPPPTAPPTSTSTPVTPTTCPVPSVSRFVSSPSSIVAGESATLSWDTISNADQLSIDDGWNLRDVSLLSSTTYQPQTTTTFRLLAYFCGENKVIAETVVTVNEPSPIPPPPPPSKPVYQLEQGNTVARQGGGGSGGRNMGLSCPNGQVVTGLSGRSGRRIDRIQLICRPLNSDGTTGVPNLSAGAGGGGGSPFSEECSANQMLVGVSGRTGGRVDFLTGMCSDIGYVESPVVSRKILGVGGGGGSNFIAQCPTGYALTGITGRSGNEIDQIHFVCTRIVQN